MEMNVTSIFPRDSVNKVMVRVYFHDDERKPHDNGTIEVFIESSDSYSDMRKRGLDAARAFLTRILAAEARENVQA